MSHLAPRLVSVAAGAALALTATLSHAELKLGFVSAAALVQQSPQAAASAKKLEQEFSARKNKLQTEFNAIKKLDEQLAKGGASMAEADRNKAVRDITVRKAAFAREQQQFTADVEKRRAEELMKFQKTVGEVISALGKKDGYDMIFTDGVAYAKDSINLTERVLQQLRAAK